MTIIDKIQQYLMCLRLFQRKWIYIWCLCSILIIAASDSNQRDFGDNTTPRGVQYTFGLRVNRSNHSKSLYDFNERPNRHAVNQLKNQIKFVLNLGLHAKNDSIDQYIVESFNIYNPDPMYVFVLPDESNRTLVFRRSNFSDISFPNTTSIQAVQNLLKSKFAHLHPSNDEIMAKQMALDQRFFAKYKEFMSSENDLHEAESLKIIEENVRTEKNFLKFMDKLNENIDNDGFTIEESSERASDNVKHQSTDYPTLIRHIHAKDHIGKYELARENKHEKVSWPAREKLSWDDFGLHGWVGKINDHHENPDENGHPMRVDFTNSALKQENLFPHKFFPILANYDPLALLTSTTTTTTPKPYIPPKPPKWPQSIHQFTFVQHHNSNSSPRPRPPSIILSSMHQTTEAPVDLFVPAPGYLPAKKPSNNSHRKPFKLDHSDVGSWDIKFNISNELRELLRLERIKLENISQSIGSKSKWIVTSSRSKHRDDDVFVGRANNPFGHSTKWKLSVTSHNDVSSSGIDDNSNDSNDSSGSNDSDDDGRQKRDVIDLYSMVKCSTGCDPLIFKGYGCYCGFLGSGNALDGIDRCCKMHDYCYLAANCPKFLEYFVPYLWKCYRGRPLCAIDNGEWGGPGSCSASLCECDRALSNCLRQFYCPRKRAVCASSPLRLLQNILMDI